MDRDKILQIIDDEYNKIKFSVNDDALKLKLQQTREQFAVSFDYELPYAEGIKAKVFRFVKRVIRKLTRFITKPYAEQMLKFQESICELNEMYIESLNESSRKMLNLEEAMWKLMSDFNDNTKLTMELSDSTAKINQYLFGGEDIAFRSYSQAGEDAIISFILGTLGDQKQGYSYLDIGCNRYKELNNTYHFYEKGMRGVLIDANPKFIDELKKNRRGDTILNVGISEKSGEKLTFYAMNWDWLSSFNKETIENTMRESPWVKIEQEIEIPVLTVNEVIDKYFNGVPTIVSLDVEGDELEILKSIDMEKYRPLIYIIETIEYREKIDLNNKRTDIINFMNSKNYKEYAFTGVNSIFLDEKQF